MGVLRDSGSTKLSLPALKRPAELRDELLESVREAAGSDFEVFGEIGRSPDRTIAYLARDLADQKLVALRLTHSPTTGNEYVLEVARYLDASVPAPTGGCPRCGAPPRSWGRFCPQCGVDLWMGPSVGDAPSSDALRDAVKQATSGKFEILGEMSRAEGGGAVYFARDIATGRVEALRLRQDRDGEYSVGLTSVLQRVLESRDKPAPKPPRRQK